MILLFIAKYETCNRIFEKKVINLQSVLAIDDYQASLIEKELDEITSFLEEKKNIINLVTFNDKNGINNNILIIIYNNIVSADRNKNISKL